MQALARKEDSGRHALRPQLLHISAPSRGLAAETRSPSGAMLCTQPRGAHGFFAGADSRERRNSTHHAPTPCTSTNAILGESSPEKAMQMRRIAKARLVSMHSGSPAPGLAHDGNAAHVGPPLGPLTMHCYTAPQSPPATSGAGLLQGRPWTKKRRRTTRRRGRKK